MTKRKCRAGSLKWLHDLYAELNKEYFDKKLPQRLRVEWADLPGSILARVRWTGTEDNYTPRVMQFSRLLKQRAMQKQVGMSMLHEMVHLKLGVHVACEEWDGEFDKEMFLLAAHGAFRLFW